MIVLVGGAGNNSGKTLFVRLMLKTFPGRFSALKVTRSEEFPCGIVKDIDLLAVPGKDTDYFLKEGALEAAWVRGNEECLGRELEKAISAVKGDVLIEGNSAMYFLRPDFSFFVRRNGEALEKESSVFFIERAHCIVKNEDKFNGEPFACGTVVAANLLKEVSAPSKKIVEILRYCLT